MSFGLVLKLTIYDILIYIVLCIRPSLDTTACDMLFDSYLNRIPRATRGARVRLAAHDGNAGAGFLGLRVDDRVECFCTR